MKAVNCPSFSVLFLCIVICVFADKNCLSPNGRKGYCITLTECPVLKALGPKSSATTEVRKFLDDSACVDGFGEPPLVCCSTDDGSINPTINQRLTNDLLPSRENCGHQPSFARILSGQETNFDEFSWMALLSYGIKDGQPEFECSGSLINSRYVLTAAHCIVGKSFKFIRLGEHDTSHDGPDCIGTHCNDPVVDVEAEEIIVHPNYNVHSHHQHNDIALIRLQREMRFTSFVAPICMPWVLNLNSSDVGKSLVAAGWGRTLSDRRSNIKLKISLPVYDRDGCENAYRSTKVYLLDSQLCAGGKFVEDTCSGDSGGPLMVFKRKWAIEGIVSYSKRGCGLENIPGVYTRVADFKDWIVDNLRE